MRSEYYLTYLQQTDFPHSVNLPRDDLDCKLLPSLNVDTAPTHGEAAIAKDLLLEVDPVLEEKGGVLQSHADQVTDTWPLVWRGLEDVVRDTVLGEED